MKTKMIDIKMEDLRISTYHPPGTSAWSVGPERGVKITHIPTGLFTMYHWDRSQHRNRECAMENLRRALAGFEPVVKDLRQNVSEAMEAVQVREQYRELANTNPEEIKAVHTKVPGVKNGKEVDDIGPYGCFNREAWLETVWVQDGWVFQITFVSGNRVFTRIPVMKEIPDPMSKNCKHVEHGYAAADPRCARCNHLEEFTKCQQ